MNQLINGKDLPLFRMVVPAVPGVNVFDWVSSKTVALGPLMVATVANEAGGWRVEMIDENNCGSCNLPRNKQGLIDHHALQQQNPAKVVGVSCGLSSAVPRALEIVKACKNSGAFIVAGGWHAIYCPEEMLRNEVDVVCRCVDGEAVINPVLDVFRENGSLEDIPGISFLEEGKIKNNPRRPEKPGFSKFLEGLPCPDFNLLIGAKIKHYPVGRIRGCRFNCEHCSVCGRPRWASAGHLFRDIDTIVRTHGANDFFLVDDRSEEDSEGTFKFFRMISKRYGDRLKFTVQMRLEAAKKTELLEVMKEAGVRIACLGYESPIKEDLQAMRKGYSASRMLEWTEIWHRYIKWIHAMFMVNYPWKNKRNFLAPKEIFNIFKRFIEKGRFTSIQVLLPGPVVGSGLRKRLEEEGKLLPLNLAPWEYYTGFYGLFGPDNMSFREFQEMPVKLMGWFYNRWTLVRTILRVFFLGYFFRGWRYLLRDLRDSWIRWKGHYLVRRWKESLDRDGFIDRIERFLKKQKSP